MTQKGRVRTTNELENLYAADEVIDKRVVALRSDESFKPNVGASDEFKDAIKETSKAEFLAIEERMLLGKSVPTGDAQKFATILRNADPSDLEYAAGFKADNFLDLLGSRSKRLAFYNHTAKRFTRMIATQKGDLAIRRIGKLNDVDEQILRKLKDKIIADPEMGDKVKIILLENV